MRKNHIVRNDLALAVERRRPGAGLRAPSNRGSQYASDHSQRRRARPGIPCRRSRRADGWDNALLESFFASWNEERLHQALDYRTPAQVYRQGRKAGGGRCRREGILLAPPALSPR